MKKPFALGMLSGASALALAVPLLAQGVFAASGATASGEVKDVFFKRGPVTQENVQTMIDRDEALLDNIDSLVTVLKDATTKHKNALTTAAAIVDETARTEAVHAAQENFHATMKAAIESNTALKGVMLPFGGPHGKMHGRGPGDLAEKLGMTPEELKAALDSGKTIEAIAEEKGVTLPEKGKFHIKLNGEKVPTAQ